MAARLALMDGGRIVRKATPTAIYDTLASGFVATRSRRLLPAEGICSGRGSILGADAAITVTDLAAKAKRAHLVIRLEDAPPVMAHPDNRLGGSVIATAFHDRCWRRLSPIGRNAARIDWHDARSIGETRRFSLDPARCVMVDAPGDIDAAAVQPTSRPSTGARPC